MTELGRSAPLKSAPLLLISLYAVIAVPAFRDPSLPYGVLMISVTLAAALITLSVVDLRTLRLPDALTLPLIAAGPLLAFALGWDGILWRIASAAAGFIVLFAISEGYLALRGRAGLGMGDAKLLAAAGAWLGMEGLPAVMLWACASALLSILVAMLLRVAINSSTRIPFGPFLALGFWLVWLYGAVV